jgi:hypothetical protein
MRKSNSGSTRQSWRMALVMAVCLIGAGLAPQIAKADIVIGGSTQDIVFTGLGSGEVSVMFGNCSFNGTDTSCVLSGTTPTPYILTLTYAGTTDATVFGPNGGPPNSEPGVFPVTINWIPPAVVTLNGTPYSFVYATADDGSNNPHFDGTWSGGTTFDYTLDNIMNSCTGLPVGVPCNLEDVSNQPGATVSQTISSGEFVTIPEPGSLLLLGSGLLGLAGLLRRRPHA